MTAQARNTSVRLRDDAVVVIHSDVEFATMNWSDVDLIEGFKLDCLVVDCIVIRLTSIATGRFLDIDEEMTGHDAFKVEMERRYSVHHENWWREVAFPAFAQNLTTIWRRSS